MPRIYIAYYLVSSTKHNLHIHPCIW